MRFPAKNNAGCPKAPRDFPPRKDGILYPRRVVLALPSPSQRLCGRTDGRTDGHVTITSQPKFLGLIGYQISLAIELRWRALPAGSAKRKDKKTPKTLTCRGVGRISLKLWSFLEDFQSFPKDEQLERVLESGIYSV